MDQKSLTKFLLNVLLLMSANIICLHGNSPTGLPSLHCVSDYLYNVDCTLSTAASAFNFSSNSSYWLTFRQNHLYSSLCSSFKCLLRNKHEKYVCTVNTSAHIPEGCYPQVFMDLDSYKISLCSNLTDGPDVCHVLDDNYRPCENIKPNAPCCFAVNHNSTQHHFTWKSTYEIYEDYIFRYQLQITKSGRQHHDDKVDGYNEVFSSSFQVLGQKVTPLISYSSKQHLLVDNEIFAPMTKYAAKVRSRTEIAYCDGGWSEWSPVVNWKTNSVTTDLLLIPQVLQISLVPIVALLIILVLVYVAVKICRKRVFIPTPEPYFHVLYSDCQGDFKSWVPTHENTEMLTVETSAHIDSLIKCSDDPPKACQTQVDHQVMDGRAYCNIPVSSCESSHLSLSCAVNTMNSQSATEDQTLSSEPGSPIEGDSGYWQYSDIFVEKGAPGTAP